MTRRYTTWFLPGPGSAPDTRQHEAASFGEAARQHALHAGSGFREAIVCVSLSVAGTRSTVRHFRVERVERFTVQAVAAASLPTGGGR